MSLSLSTRFFNWLWVWRQRSSWNPIPRFSWRDWYRELNTHLHTWSHRNIRLNRFWTGGRVHKGTYTTKHVMFVKLPHCEVVTALCAHHLQKILHRLCPLAMSLNKCIASSTFLFVHFFCFCSTGRVSWDKQPLNDLSVPIQRHLTWSIHLCRPPAASDVYWLTWQGLSIGLSPLSSNCLSIWLVLVLARGQQRRPFTCRQTQWAPSQAAAIDLACCVLLTQSGRLV